MINKFVIFFLCVALLPWAVFAEEETPNKTVLIAILARNKAHTLPKYLKCLDNLEYDKKLITVYINTNNNDDTTEEILLDWIEKNQDKYAFIELESHDVINAPNTKPHEWNSTRFSILATIRMNSLFKTKEYGCDYYFVVDCDNFIIPATLKDLVNEDKPIIAPMLKSIPEPVDVYSNFFGSVTRTGYYQDHPNYYKILDRQMVGTFLAPVVHCSYLINAEYIEKLTYIDGTSDYEFIIFSRSARANNVEQYICNKKEYGYLLHFHTDVDLEEESRRMKAIKFQPPFD